MIGIRQAPPNLSGHAPPLATPAAPKQIMEEPKTTGHQILCTRRSSPEQGLVWTPSSRATSRLITTHPHRQQDTPLVGISAASFRAHEPRPIRTFLEQHGTAHTTRTTGHRASDPCKEPTVRLPTIRANITTANLDLINAPVDKSAGFHPAAAGPPSVHTPSIRYAKGKLALPLV